MEIKFIWIREYQGLKDFQVNLSHSGPDSFFFENEELKVISNSRPPFSFSENITGITAFAGANGAGKSTTIDIIKQLIGTVDNGMIGYLPIHDAIVCVERNIYYHKSIEFKNIPELKKLGYDVLPYEDSPLEDWSIFTHKDSPYIKFIYHNSGILVRNYGEEVGVSYITDDYYEKQQTSFYGYTLAKQLSEIRYSRMYLKEQVFYRIHEQLRLLMHVNAADNSVPSIRVLKLNLFLRADDKRDDKNERDAPHHSFDSEEIGLRNFYSSQPESISEARLVKMFFRHTRLRVLESMMTSDISKKMDVQNAEAWIRSEDDFNKMNKRLFGAADEYYFLLLGVFEQGEFNFGDYSVWFNDPGNQFGIIDYWLLLPSMEFVWSDKLKDALLKLFEFESNRIPHKYQNTEKNFRVFDVSLYPYLSTGEFYRENLYSRLFHTIKDEDHAKDFVLMFDESDAFSHPEWKRKFLAEMIQFLELNFPDKRFQLIIATHSPYLLSDLPSESVVLLSKDTEGVMSQVRGIKTFGANINELLGEAFFLQNGTIGEFALTKIKSLINFLEDETLQDHAWTQDNVIRFIEEIGDSLIRIRLLDLANRKFNIGQNDTDEMQWLQNRLAQLERRNENG